MKTVGSFMTTVSSLKVLKYPRKGLVGCSLHSDFAQNRNIWFSGSVTGTGGSLRIQITAQHWLLCSEYRIRT